MKNYKFSIKKNDNYNFVKTLATQKELMAARIGAKGLVKKSPDNIGMRSCWQCNGAHVHFLEGEWGSWVLSCFECGRFYYKGIDITIYNDKKDDKKKQK